ncbi:MAG: N-acetylmuramoyl-L-alanine amidase LytC precursor [bacterium ADurb.Bin429]|nr:MAG: N-acetylmuramoyl-L-alanine amidase LytC precursor [bacterium ADurb.Bin429]
MKIYLDPGHGEGVTGQRDPGAVGPNGLSENDVTFDVAKRLGHLLRAKGFTTLGATLNAARDEENLNEAIAVANAQGAEIFISLHCNAAASPNARGVEVWHGGSGTAEVLAQAVLHRIGEQLAGGKGTWVQGRRYPLANRGAKRGTFAVLRKTRMPAILIELAFISNSQEEAWLKEPTVRQQFAQAIADGIEDVTTKKGA